MGEKKESKLGNVADLAFGRLAAGTAGSSSSQKTAKEDMLAVLVKLVALAQCGSGASSGRSEEAARATSGVGSIVTALGVWKNSGALDGAVSNYKARSSGQAVT